MKTSVERIDETTVKLSITVEAARVGKAVDEAARHMAADVKVPGFRPGKVPRRVLETRVGKPALLQHAVRDALPDFYAEAVQEQQLEVVGPPQFDVEVFEDGKDAEFSASVEVRPEIELPDYTGIRIPHPEWEVTDDDVKTQLEALRERFAELETVDREVHEGDYVVMTVTGSKDGQKVEDASGEDILYEVNDPAESNAELDRQLLGSRAGGILKFTDSLGPDYGDRAGEELDFTVIVKEVKGKQLPELDDDFAITASEFDTLDELRAEVEAQLAREKRAYARQSLRGKVVEAVADQVEVALPKSMVEEEVRFHLTRIAHQAEQQGVSLDQFLQLAGTSAEQIQSDLQEQAREAVKAQLVVDAVARSAEIDVTQEDLGAEVARQSARLGRPPEELAEFMSHPDRIGALVNDVYRRKAIDHLVEQVEVLSAPPADDIDLGPAAEEGGEAQAAGGAQTVATAAEGEVDEEGEATAR